MTRQYAIDYYGFVYIWYDRKRKMYYIGSHRGPNDDGYSGSSSRFKRALNKRPEDFHRRILTYVNTSDRKDLLLEEERWLQMIKPHHLGTKYYNIKRRATGGFVTEGYNDEKYKAYKEKLRNRSCGAKHYAARSCFCINRVYDTITEAKHALGWDPTRRLNSRKHEDFYYVDEGKPSIEEIQTNLSKEKKNKQRSIEAMRQQNLSLPGEYHTQRISKTTTTRRQRNSRWKTLKSLRKGRKISVDGQIFHNLQYAASILNESVYQIRKRIKSDDYPTYFFVKE